MDIAWNYLNKRSAAIEALKDYAAMEWILANESVEIRKKQEDMSNLRSSAPNGMPSAHNPHAAEARLAAQIDEIDVLRERHSNAQEFMAWFRPAWERLAEDDRWVLAEFYTNSEQDRAIQRIMEHFNIVQSAACNKKNRALNRLTVWLYGK